jgi:hypothetical protein
MKQKISYLIFSLLTLIGCEKIKPPFTTADPRSNTPPGMEIDSPKVYYSSIFSDCIIPGSIHVGHFPSPGVELATSVCKEKFTMPMYQICMFLIPHLIQ